ncbi:MAG: hypothetical protein J0H02_03535 [Armatimonadetes bacterium]|jgi:hypothetical protein|nr:hypothetical protein [Armatimonadota bacterium]
MNPPRSSTKGPVPDLSRERLTAEEHGPVLVKVGILLTIVMVVSAFVSLLSHR